jgi:hypothetical protein
VALSRLERWIGLVCENSEWHAKATTAFHKECDLLNETVAAMRSKDVLRSYAKLRAESAAITETVSFPHSVIATLHYDIIPPIR